MNASDKPEMPATPETAEMPEAPEKPGKPYHHGDLRRALVQTAAAMLAEDDAQQFTLREVARRAGVSHAAPYKHFPDKAALLAELARGGLLQLQQAMHAAATPRPGSARHELLAVAQAYIAFGVARPALYRLMFGAVVAAQQAAPQPAGPPDAPAVEAAAPAPEDAPAQDPAPTPLRLLQELLQRGQQAGVFKRRPASGQAAACWAQVHGLTLLAIDGQLLPQHVGDAPMAAALATLLEGLLT